MHTSCELSPQTSPSGPPPTLSQVHKEYATYVQNLLKSRVPTRDLQDLVQLSFMEINQGLPRYDPARPIQPWIATIVFRTARRHVRRSVLRARSEEFFSRDPTEFDPGSEDRIEARELVPQLLTCLKDRQLEIVLRHLRDEEPIDVISQDLGISTDGGYKLLQTAIAKIKDAKRRQEATERRQLGERTALMLPFGLSFRMETWLPRVRSWLVRPLAQVKAAIGSGVLMVALGVLLLPLASASAPPLEVTPPIAAAVREAPPVPAAQEANAAPMPAPTLSAAQRTASRPGTIAKPSSAALPAEDLTAENASLTLIQTLAATNPVAALEAVERHKKRFPNGHLEIELVTVEGIAKTNLAQQRQATPRRPTP